MAYLNLFYFSKKKKGKYNASDLAELQAFASVRGVAIVGEIDVPGHSSGLVQTMPQTFGFASSPDVTDIIDFTNKSVVAAVQDIFREVVATFPTSPVIHMGGDEVQLSKLTKLPEVIAAIKREGVTCVADLYRLFIGEMHTFATSLNKTLHVSVENDMP